MADSKFARKPRDKGTGVQGGGELHIPVYPTAQFAEFAAEVRKTMEELGDLLISKHRDYGPKNISDSPGGPLNGLRVRMHDKTARINNLIDNGTDAQHEPLEDSFKDLANYAIIALLVLRDKWDK
jgi:hypothetical protein